MKKSSKIVMSKTVLALQVPATWERKPRSNIASPSKMSMCTNQNVVMRDLSFAQTGNSLVRVPARGGAVACQVKFTAAEFRRQGT